MQLKPFLVSALIAVFAGGTASLYAADETPAAEKSADAKASKSKEKEKSKKTKQHSHMEEKTGIPASAPDGKEAKKPLHDHRKENKQQ